MVELAQTEDESSKEDLLAEAEAECKELRKKLDELEVLVLLSGEYDQREAVVTIRSGAGGVDAADFAEMLCACTCGGLKRMAIRRKCWTLRMLKKQG